MFLMSVEMKFQNSLTEEEEKELMGHTKDLQWLKVHHRVG